MRIVILIIFFVLEANAAHFTLPIQVTSLPIAADHITVSTTVDFPTLIDERTIRLRRGRTEIPFQFSAHAQTRPAKRPLHGGSPDKVSYAAEYSVTNTPADLKLSGELTFVVSPKGKPNADFTLEFSTPKEGRIVQVPFPPQNFRVFDARGWGTPVRWFPEMQLHPQWPKDGVVHFYEGRELITSYHLGADASARRPYFYPVIGPDKIPLTEFGKPHDPTGSHAHHYSLWITHHDVNGLSFWGERAGTISHEALDLMEDGPLFSRIVQRLRWNFSETNLLRETRTITMHRAAKTHRALDIEMSLSPATSNAVTLGKTSFGFLAARVAQSMTVFDGAGEIRTAAGKLNESQVHLTRAEWLDQSGPIAEGKWGGIAILDSPDNPHFPTGWHCRDDGWAGAAFNMGNDYKLQPNATLRLKYRIILHGGNARHANIPRRFAEWSARPRIQIGNARKK